MYIDVHFWAEIGNRAGVPSAEEYQFHLYPSPKTPQNTKIPLFFQNPAILGRPNILGFRYVPSVEILVFFGVLRFSGLRILLSYFWLAPLQAP